jgi:hypothetical protein
VIVGVIAIIVTTFHPFRARSYEGFKHKLVLWSHLTLGLTTLVKNKAPAPINKHLTLELPPVS